MPTYEYECKSCGHNFDYFQGMKDEPLKVCPECGKELRRLINGGTGIIFKGGGFYTTDNNSKSGKSVTASTSKAKPGTETPAAESKKPAQETPKSETTSSSNSSKVSNE